MVTVPSIETTIPKTMRAVQAKDYGDIDAMLTVEDGIIVPRLADLPQKKRKDFMLIQTLAVSLAPGDCRVLSGKTRELQGPPSFPYIPGGDCCGIVVELSEDSPKDLPFQLGDRVAARFVEGPRGALGEYAIVSTRVADKVPENLPSDGAAALAGACPATELAEFIHTGERVLVLGAGGGVGSHFCQVIRERGASLVVGVSKTPERLSEAPISCDKTIDYTQDDPFAREDFIKEPFDVVVDLATGGWPHIIQNVDQNSPLIVKPASLGGRYLTTAPDTPVYEVHSIWQALQLFLFPSLWRAIVSRTWSRSKIPGYTYGMALSIDRKAMTQTMDLFRAEKLKPVMDPQGPFPFTTEGVRAAFRLQESRHPHGKVVVHVASNGKS
jgi:NADPH:quinone reductase-like Zn-dependent oxidoreductase